MEIKRINTYEDDRFSKRTLYQHGCFLADGKPYEIEIISDSEAVVRGKDATVYPQVIEEFRFYTPHITVFYNSEKQVIQQYPPVQLLTIPLTGIQPSQFFVDEDKIAAVSTFLQKWDDIIIQVIPHNGRYISLDGHTRLYYAVMQGWDSVRAVAESPEDYIFKFVEEANHRGIFTSKDMTLLSHAAYEVQWNGFCDAFFANAELHPEDEMPNK